MLSLAGKLHQGIISLVTVFKFLNVLNNKIFLILRYRCTLQEVVIARVELATGEVSFKYESYLSEGSSTYSSVFDTEVESYIFILNYK
jgi:hypothetical protein